MSLSEPASRLIGCSDYPALAGCDPYGSRFDLWSRVRGDPTPERSERLEAAGRIGSKLELPVAEMLMEELGMDPGKLVKPPCIEQPAGREWQRYSLDFYVDDPSYPMVIEVKCRSAWSFRSQGWGSGMLEVPVSLNAQVQGQMEAVWADRDRWKGTSIPEVDEVQVPVLVGGSELRHYVVRRNREIGAGLVALAEKFWAEHVLTGTPPPLDGSDAAASYVRRRYQGTDRTPPRDATPIEHQLAEASRAVSRELRRMHAERQELLTRLGDALGSSDCIQGPDWRAQWVDVRGTVDYRKAIDAIITRHDLDRAVVQMIMNEFRRAPTRRLDLR